MNSREKKRIVTRRHYVTEPAHAADSRPSRKVRETVPGVTPARCGGSEDVRELTGREATALSELLRR